MKNKEIVLYDSYYDEELYNNAKNNLIEQLKDDGFTEEEIEEEITEERIWGEYYAQIELDFEDLLWGVKEMDLGKILIIADLGLWNGRRNAVKVVGSKSMFYSECDYLKIYTDGKNILSENSHHDGTNYYTYREIKDGVDIDNLIFRIRSGEQITERTLGYYTRSLYPKFKEYFGWRE